MDDKITILKEMIENSLNIVFLGGAGVSTESNIPDFRSGGGLFAKKYPYPAETMLSHSFFRKHTAEFFDFYINNMLYLDALPNPAHFALAKLEEMGKLKAIVTQNIDGLHQRAGSKNVLELHGSVHRNYCTACGKFYDAPYMQTHPPIPLCECGHMIKPDVVLYEEPLDNEVFTSAIHYIKSADTLIIGGTSLVVYPAASLVNYFKGHHLVVINKSETGKDCMAGLVINDSMSHALKWLVDK